MKKNVLKHGFVIGISLLTLGSGVMVGPNQTYAESKVSKRNGITDVQAVLEKAGAQYYDNNLALTFVHPSNDWDYQLKERPDSITYLDPNFGITDSKIDKLHKESTTPKFIGSNKFTNTTDQPQTYRTTSYSEKYDETTSTAVQSGFKVGGETFKFFLPFDIVGIGKINAEYNASTTQTNTKTQSYTLTVPAQSVQVPAGKTYEVKVQMSQTSYAGDISFSGSNNQINVSGPNVQINATGVHAGWMGMTEERNFKYQETALTIRSGLTSSQNQAIREQGVELAPYGMSAGGIKITDGKGSFSGVAGADLDVVTYDITDPKNVKLVNTQRVAENQLKKQAIYIQDY